MSFNEFIINISDIPEWYDEKIHSTVLYKIERYGRLKACKYIYNISKEKYTTYICNLQYIKTNIVDVLWRHIEFKKENVRQYEIELNNFIKWTS